MNLFTDVNGKFSGKRVGAFVGVIIAILVTVVIMFMDKADAMPVLYTWLGFTGTCLGITVAERKQPDNKQ